jgi:translation initiation factor 1
MQGGGRLVFSTDSGRVCPGCGWPAKDCRCSGAAEEAVPVKPVAKLRLEKKGRGGKNVTVVDGLPRNAAFLTDLSHALKKACGTGGTAREASIELQGDHREKLAALLSTRGFTVKGWPA